MLPNKMKISERATHSLRRLQGNTGLTANIGARLAFFISVERGFRFQPEMGKIEHTGRELDKYTWLGNHVDLVEMLLKTTYPGFTKQQLYKAWVSHIDDGSIFIESKGSIAALIEEINY